MASRNANGTGTVYQRKDGRYVAAMFVPSLRGGRRRVTAYAQSATEARQKLRVLADAAHRNLPAADGSLTVGRYLDHWLTSVVPAKTRPRTLELYELTVRLHIKPLLGHIKLNELSLPDVQAAANSILASANSTRGAHLFRTVLSSALSRAMREELVFRNVARLIELPKYERKEITPWTPEQATVFLKAVKGHQWEPGYQLLVLYGMRRGEVLGLRWSDIDLTTNTIRVRQQIQRIDGELRTGPVKTSAGRRDLPLLPIIKTTLLELAARNEIDLTAGTTALGEHLVLTSKTGAPVEPGNFARTFQLIAAKADLPRITVHHTRHTAATMLKKLGVPARDAQLILGHSNVTTTQQLYQHGDIDAQRTALESMQTQLLGHPAPGTPDNAEDSGDRSALLSPLLSTVENPDLALDLDPNENRRLPEAETADFLGGSGGARTHDILLKSQILAAVAELPTSVIRDLHTRTARRIVGRVAVNTAVKTVPSHVPSARRLDHLPTLRDACRAALTEQLRRRSFPLNLIPAIDTLEAA